MASEIYVQGQRVRLTPSSSVGKGGEADIYQIAKDLVVKVFKQPDHPDVSGNAFEEEAARQRLAEHQRKLRQFPRIPAGAKIVVPIDLATDKTGREILGYTMALVPNSEVILRYSERSYRGSVLDNNRVAGIFLDLFETVRLAHQSDLVIGDFNDLNVLVQKDTPWLIDADSFQFGSFFCKVYTERYVDPRLCSPKERRPVLAKPHTKDSDWYAYSVMLFRSLLLCDPYGGVYKPAKKSAEVLHGERPLKRITVFNKDVRYPRPAVPFDLLSDELLQWFHEVFEKDVRKEFPVIHLKNFRWTICKNCGLEHARPLCPTCRLPAPAHVFVREVAQVRGKVTSTRVFKTSGEVVHAAWQNGKLCYIYCTPDHFGPFTYRREDAGIVIASEVPLRSRWRTQGSRTLFGLKGKLQVYEKNEPDDTPTYVDSYGPLPVYDANDLRRFWVQAGVLYRDSDLGPERIGDVLENQTLFWVGDKFGFGFYRAGDLSVAFVFDSEKGGLNDGVKLPQMRGQLVDAICYLSGSLAWFLCSIKEGPKIVNRAVLVTRTGEVKGAAEAVEGDGSWLGNIHAKCASGDFLFSVTDDGLVRLAGDGTTITKSAEFPDTESFVHPGCSLFPAKGGLYVVDRQEIRLLKIG